MLEDEDDTVDSLEDWKVEDWEHPTVEVGSLSEDLLKFDEELKRQIEEDKAWLEEEEKADQLLRRDIEQLQLTEEKNKELWDKMNCPEPELPPEIKERLDELQNRVKTLEEQLEEKNLKLQERDESSAEILAKLNETTKRMIDNDKIFKESFEKIRREYGELETVLKRKLDSYQKLNKDLELRLNEKEGEIQELSESHSKVEELKNQLSEMEEKLNENNKKLENMQNYSTKLKAQLKIIKTDRDQLKKEKEESVDANALINKISLLEEELAQQAKTDEETVESLKNKIALLEEEKGNLQLQLVDLDELKESVEAVNRKFNDALHNYEEAKTVMEDTQERYRQLASDFMESKNVVKQHEETIDLIKLSLDAVTEEKISAVMKCVELEECLQSRDSQLAALNESLVAFQETSAAQTERELMSDYNMSNGLQLKLNEAQEELVRLREENDRLNRQLSGAQRETEELRGQLSEALVTVERLKKTETGETASEAEVRFKKLAAKYKIKVKQCQTLEESVEALKEEIAELTRGSAEVMVRLKLLRCLRQLKSMEEKLFSVMDRQEVTYLFDILANWESDPIVAEKDDLIRTLENEKLKLEDSIRSNETEFEMLRALYEKESAKNDQFMSDLRSLECEMSEGKEELLERFKQLTEVHGNCQSVIEERDRYIERLEADVGNMKTRLLELEKNDERQLELKERVEQLVGKLEEAEVMTQNFHVYREQIEKENRELKENEVYLKDKVVNLQVELESSEETCELVKKSNLNLEKERETLEIRMEEATRELGNLREVKEAYNNTLDKIEFLNEELKEAMEGFERKTELLATLENEREKLIRKVSDLEIAFNEMEKKLFDAYGETDRLKSEIEALQVLHEEKMKELERVESAKSLEKTDLFADSSKDDEGWGWSGDVGPLDPNYLSQKQLAIEAERNSLLEEMNAVKIKNQKLMKKIKEMKMEQEVLSRSKKDSVGFSDLDFALQEEFRLEIDKLQAKVAELSQQVTSLKAERDALTSRVDTLTSANYELVDMKERQDIEVQMWQKRSNELMTQLQTPRKSEVTEENQLTENLTALADENEELRAVLTEKKEELERACLREQDLEEELAELKVSLTKSDELNHLESELSTARQELALKIEAHDALVNANQELDSRLRSLENCVDQLKSTHEEEVVRLKQQIDDLEAQIDQQKSIKDEDENGLIRENEELKSSLEEKTVAIELLTLKCQGLENQPNSGEEIARLKGQLLEETEKLSTLKTAYDQLKGELELAESLAKKDKELQNTQTKNQASAFFDSPASDVFSTLSLNEEKIQADRLKKENAELKETLETLQLTVAQLQDNSNILVKQMDAFRAESSALLTAKEEEVRRLNEELNELKFQGDGRLDELIRENDSLKSDVQGFQLYQEMNLKEFNDQIQRLNLEKDNEICKLKEILENDREEIKSLKCELENYKIHSESIDYDLAKRNELVQELEMKLASRRNEESDQTRRALDELQEERARLERELEQKLAQVEHFDKTVATLRQTAPDVPSDFLDQMREKDVEINRLTKTLIETQEKLLLAEQGKMYPDVRNLQLKLDQALYTLHERDLRCEELTQEVIQLLEERDVLQLRLSQAIRAYDAVKSDANSPQSDSPVRPTNEKVEYRKDPVVQLERETRHNQMMQLYSSETPHQDETSNPTDYGIFNWFFGSSPSSQPHQVESNNT